MPTKKKSENIDDELCKNKSSNIKYTQRQLDYFSGKHYTYINQIFGDETVREIIQEQYHNPNMELIIEKANEDFEDADDSFHHVVFDKKNKKKICSSDDGYQNMEKNENDTLCQSYSLMTYLKKPFPKKMTDAYQKERQMRMIKMYREMLENKDFTNELNDVETDAFINYMKDDEPQLNMEWPKIIEKIKNTLDCWENYGYNYFIGTGKIRKS